MKCYGRGIWEKVDSFARVVVLDWQGESLSVAGDASANRTGLVETGIVRCLKGVRVKESELVDKECGQERRERGKRAK